MKAFLPVPMLLACLITTAPLSAQQRPKINASPETLKALGAHGAKGQIDRQTGDVIAVDLSLPKFVDPQVADSEEMTALLGKISELKKLRVLIAHGPNVTDEGLKQIAGLSELRTLDLLQANVGNEGLKVVAGMPQLEILNLQKTNVTDLAPLASCKKPKALNLRSTNVNDKTRAHLSGLRELQVIQFETNLFVSNEGLRHLLPIKSLVSLTAMGAQYFNDETVEIASQFPNLQYLILDDAKVTPKGATLFPEMKGLVALSLRRCTLIDDSALVPIGKMPNLTSLKLRQTSITDKGLPALKNLKLTLLDLNETAIGNAGLEAIQGMTTLETLALWASAVDDEGLKTVGGFKNLVSLDLQDLPITDEGVAHLTGLSKLEDLNLNGSMITDAGLKQLQKLTKLKRLRLENVLDVTSDGIDAFKQAVPGCEIIK